MAWYRTMYQLGEDVPRLVGPIPAHLAYGSDLVWLDAAGGAPPGRQTPQLYPWQQVYRHGCSEPLLVPARGVDPQTARDLDGIVLTSDPWPEPVVPPPRPVVRRVRQVAILEEEDCV